MAIWLSVHRQAGDHGFTKKRFGESVHSNSKYSPSSNESLADIYYSRSHAQMVGNCEIATGKPASQTRSL